jgi:hypothetical protein
MAFGVIAPKYMLSQIELKAKGYGIKKFHCKLHEPT